MGTTSALFHSIGTVHFLLSMFSSSLHALSMLPEISSGPIGFSFSSTSINLYISDFSILISPKCTPSS
ncbi:hypothetical protein E2C01_066908 [Portunus trituberculatus]|uniref:Uncharacterized protein n=1 Tax=Portunus trituberculatus TaxID=210409 RepID=A0A5B7HS09_PORTR|nr:hypothetical protein [Portunus trituberculatus]